MSAHARSRPLRASGRRSRFSGRVPLALVGLLALAVLGVAIGLLFAGSPQKIAAGVRVAGVNVGGLTGAEAERLLERRARAVLHTPVRFTAAGKTFKVTPDQLGVRVDWKAAVADARRQGAGFGPLRGFKRLDVRVFGADVTPETEVFQGALELELAQLAKQIDSRRREPSIELRGLRPVLVHGASGRVLDRKRAAPLIVHSLASFERDVAVALPVRSQAPRLPDAALAPARAAARRAVSAPVRLTLGVTRFKLSRFRLAQLLELPADGRRTLRIGGRGADAWLARLGKQVDRPASDAGFAVDGSSVRVLPAKPGLRVDGLTTSTAVLRAALRPARRVAAIAVVEAPARRSTAEAKAMGITGLVSSYTTLYGGDPNRVHNVQLVAHLVDGALVAPGATFSFNGTTGERSVDKGFLEAPVIINGELQTGIGGGVCQVSTTVFNAAYEAGLRITARTNHALYISHYPQGRDATVNYPDLDLKFVNDTPRWLLLRTFVGSSQLTVNLYGAPQQRRVESSVSPLVVTGPAHLEKVVDPSLEPGQKVVEDYGEPSRSTSVHRTVYTPSGKLLHDDTWYSSYRSEPKIVHIGPPAEKTEKKDKKKEQPGATTTTPTTETATTPAAPAQVRP